MDHIETKILNSYTIQEAAQNMVFAARLTQQGHSIQNMDDLMALYQKSFTDKTVDRIASLPHPTVQKFTVITVAIVGASRRRIPNTPQRYPCRATGYHSGSNRRLCSGSRRSKR